MKHKALRDEWRTAGDEFSRTLFNLGLDGGEVSRLEQTARFFEKLEWQIARSRQADTRERSD